MYNLPFNKEDKVIELGGGNVPIFRPNLDVRSGENIDIVADLNEKLPIQNDSYNGIFCKYMIEHLSWRKVKDFIKECFRILKPGGTAVFISPNLLEQAKVLTEIDKFDDKWVCMIFGDNDYPENTHRCGFSPEFAGRIFKEAGFETVVVTPLPEWRGDMIIEAKKPMNNLDRKDMFDKDYFHGGAKFGGYAHEGYRDFNQHWVTLDKILELKPTSVLELGCARGYTLKKLQDLGLPVAGLEISHHCCLTKVLENVIEWDICETPWPIPDKYFDLCFSIAVLEHIPEEFLPNVISEINRVSQRGLHGIDFGENDDGFDKTHFTLKDEKWWSERLPVTQKFVDKEDLERTDFIYNHIPTGDNKLKINIGSYINMFHYGWVNFDIIDLSGFAQANGYKFQQLDARKGIPFKDNTVDLIYSSHFIEHLTFEEGYKFLQECHRVMKPGGIFRLTMPDSEKLINLYKENKLNLLNEINDGNAAAKSELEKLWSFLFPGHGSAYDWNNIKLKAESIGFHIDKLNFREGDKQILTETIETFKDISLFVELVK